MKRTFVTSTKTVLLVLISVLAIACSKKGSDTAAPTANSTAISTTATPTQGGLPTTIEELKQVLNAKASAGDQTSITLIRVVNEAEKGDKGSQFILGAMYRDGVYIKRDYAAAFKTFTASAEQGEPNSQWFLGSMNENGESVPVDRDKAAYWYTKCSTSSDKTAADRCKQALKALKEKMAKK